MDRRSSKRSGGGWRRSVGLVGLVGTAGLAAALGTVSCERTQEVLEPRVVVVCVEALRHDDPDRGDMPHFARLAREGARARRLVPIFPTNSGPNQAAIATGTLPVDHGIINNIFFDRTLEEEFEGDSDQYETMLGAEPIWVTASRAGVPAGTINWPGGDAPYDGITASRVLEDDGDDDAERVEAIVEWLGERGPDVPRLALVYLDFYDDVGHELGPETHATVMGLPDVDDQIGEIIDAIEDNGGPEFTTLFVLGDHGMTEVQVCIYVQSYLAKLGYTGSSLSSGATSNVYLERGLDASEVKAALEATGDPFTVYLPAEVPARYGYDVPDRVGDLVLVGAEGTYFRDRGGRSQPVGNARKPGMHGFAPEEPDMQTAFVAWGRGVTAGHEWEERSILDLYPTVCELLGITPSPEADGIALPGIAAPPAPAPDSVTP